MCAILSSVACPALQFFPPLSHKRHDFRKKKLNIKRVLISCTKFTLQLFSETFLILRRIERYVIKNVYWSSRKVPVCLHIKYPLVSTYSHVYLSSREVPVYLSSREVAVYLSSRKIPVYLP
jgi:hypothetical protein